MEKTDSDVNIGSPGFEDFEDTLSFCDLTFHEQELDEPIKPLHCNKQEPQQEDFFEFSTSQISNSHSFPVDNFVFCGKLIPQKTQDTKFEYFDPRRSSLLPLTSDQLVKKGNRSKSLHVKDMKPSPSPLVNKTFRHQSSGNSRKHKVLIGLAKIPTKMELSDIKKRQSRCAEKLVSAPLPVVDDKKRVLSGIGGGVEDVHGSLVKPFSCRNYFARALARCVPFVKRYA